jgi:hypothetical protein
VESHAAHTLARQLPMCSIDSLQLVESLKTYSKNSSGYTCSLIRRVIVGPTGVAAMASSRPGGFLQNIRAKLSESLREFTGPFPDALEQRLSGAVERATSDLLTGPDWGANFEIVDTINNDPTCAICVIRCQSYLSSDC